MSYLLFKRGNDLGGWIVFLIAAFVYGMTIEPTASFGIVPNLFHVPKSYKLVIHREHLSICLSGIYSPSLRPMLRRYRAWSTF